MKQVHFVVQGKGGVGKSLIASMLAQYFRDFSTKQVFCFDTDPVNPTFSRYQALNAEIINILNENNDINRREFDTLTEQLLSHGNNIAVVDNGSATFIPLMSYVAENDLIALLNEKGVEIIFHIPLYGGDALEDTMQGLFSIIKRLPTKMIVWLNHNQNKISFPDNKKFTDLEIYKKHADRILGVVELKQRNAETFGVDIKEMTQRHLTVAEIKTANSEKNKDKVWRLTEIQRIILFYKDICEQLDEMQLLPTPAAEQKEKADKVEKSTATA
ncbi:MAG: conjugal transfer protein TraL [Neisseriaceae bacterium]|nr:conjugal transfer protein TraL [Neisseriaceae bacterium]